MHSKGIRVQGSLGDKMSDILYDVAHKVNDKKDKIRRIAEYSPPLSSLTKDCPNPNKKPLTLMSVNKT